MSCSSWAGLVEEGPCSTQDFCSARPESTLRDQSSPGLRPLVVKELLCKWSDLVWVHPTVGWKVEQKALRSSCGVLLLPLSQPLCGLLKPFRTLLFPCASCGMCLGVPWRGPGCGDCESLSAGCWCRLRVAQLHPCEPLSVGEGA